MISMRSQSAFSLVELSIVLVILGLLIGGILGGQALIRAAELRAVPTETARYATAVQTFRDKYFALPGDMLNATAFWGIAAGTTGNDNTCRNTVQNATATCNGNGNGQISSSWTTSGEIFLFWKHLSNAGLIEGSFPGTDAASGGRTSPFTVTSAVMPGWNVPNSRLSRGIWQTGQIGTFNVAIQKFYGSYPVIADPHYINTLILSSSNSDFGDNGTGPLRPDEAWNIDTKMDDGLPGRGKVEALRGGSSASAGPCLTNADPALAAYDLADSGTGSCAMVFVGIFL